MLRRLRSLGLFRFHGFGMLCLRIPQSVKSGCAFWKDSGYNQRKLIPMNPPSIGNDDIQIGEFANTVTAAPTLFCLVRYPGLAFGASGNACGRIGIKIGNPANISGAAAFVGFARFAAPSKQRVEIKDD